MTDTALRRMTGDEFLEWSLDQEDRYELVDGVPIPMGEWIDVDGRPTFMAGATTEHDTVVINTIIALGTRLRGKSCRPSSAGIASRMRGGNIRRPDVTIDCRRPERGATESAEPTVFFEVLSRSTRSVDFVRKAYEYHDLPSLRQYVIVDPREVAVTTWTRDAGGVWGEPDEYRSLDDVLPVVVGTELPLMEIYADVPLAD